MAKQSAFQIFNQKLKEKIGVAEQVTTYPEEPELSNKLEILTNQIKKITKEIHKQEKTTTTLLEAGAELSDSLVDGGVSFREDPLRYMLAGSLDKVAEVQRHVDDLRTKLGKQINSEVYEPLDNVIEVDVKEAKMQKSKFEKTRVELDAGISKLNGLGKKAKEEKIKEVELEVEDLRKNFSQVGMETVDKLQDTIALSEAEMLGSLVHYMELYRDFFANSNRFMVSLIPEVEEYKNYIEIQREQLHGSATAKQIEAAAAAAPPEKKFGTLKLKSLKSSFGMGDKKKVDKGTPASEIFAANKAAENDPFGKDIEHVANKDGSDVPAIVDKAVDYIENKGLQEEGIFRISASKKEVDKLKGEIAQTADENTSSPEVVVDYAEKKPNEPSSASGSEKKKEKEEAKAEKDGKKDPVRQRSAGSLIVKKSSEEDLRKARRFERAHTISVGIADPSHPAHAKPTPDTPSKKAEKSVEEVPEDGAKKKHATSPRFKTFLKKLSFRADKKDKIEKKEDKVLVEGAEVKLEKDEKKHEKKDKEKKTDEKKLEKEKKDEEKRLEKERKELEKKKKKEVEAAEKDAKKKDKKKTTESTPPESKSHEDKKELKKSATKDKKDLSSSSDSVVKYEYTPVDAHMSVNLPNTQAQGAVPEAGVTVSTPAIEVEQHKRSGEENKVEVEVTVDIETKSGEEKKPEMAVGVKVRSRSSSSSSSSSSSKSKTKTAVPHEASVEVHPTADLHVLETKTEIPHEATVEGHVLETKTEVKEPEVAVEVKTEHPVREVQEGGHVDVAVTQPEAAKEPEAKVEIKIESPKETSPRALSGEDDKEKEVKKKREKEDKARKEKEESTKKKAEKEAKKKEKGEEKERKKVEKETKKKPEKEKEKKKLDVKKVEQAAASPDESSSSSEEKEKKSGKKSPKWLAKLKPKSPKKKDDADKIVSPRDETSGDLVLNRKKKTVVVDTNDLESSINIPHPPLADSASEKSQGPTSSSASEVKLKLESTEKARAENQTHIEEQTRHVMSSVGSKLDELENQLNTLDLSISPRASATIPAEASPRDPDTPASREKLGSELQNLEAMLNNMPESVDESVKHETPSVTPVIETVEHAKETKDESSSSSSSSSSS